MPLFELIGMILCVLSHVHMGSVISLDLILFLTLPFKPLDASETRPRVCFPARDHSVDSIAKYLDSNIGTEPRQQQQQPTTTTTC